jgi:hypothetical protein
MTPAAAVQLPALIWDHCPSAVEVDELAVEFCRLESQVREAYAYAQQQDEPMEHFRERLILVTEEFGQAHATKSKLLVGASSEIVATFGSARAVDAIQVEAFRVALKRAGRTRILGRLFEECTSWRLVDGADGIIRREQLSDQLTAQFARCFVEKPRTPALKVRMVGR